jgi:hypothetical protein
VENGEDPGARIIVAAAMPMAHDPFQTILDEIVRGNSVFHQSAGIPSQGWNQRFD